MDGATRVLKRLEEMGKQKFIPSIGPIKGRMVSEIIGKYRPKRILEIGTLYGYSAILMARRLSDNGRVLTIEIDKENAEFAKENIDEAGLSHFIEVLVGDALKILPSIHGKFDLLFIDAVKDDYLLYLKLAEKNLVKGSVVIADNVGIFADDVKDYLDYVRGSKNYVSETLEFSKGIHDAIEVSVRK